MKISEIMTERLVTVRMDDQLTLVKQLFDSSLFHHLLVEEGSRLVGVVSDRDLLKAMSPYLGTAAEINRDTLTLSQRVHKIMTRKPVTLMADATLDDAIAIFNTEKISCIPIVDEENHAVGIVTWRDVLKAL